MENYENLKTYDGVEQFQLEHLTKDELLAYIHDKMESAVSDTDFIKGHIFKGDKLNVCEIGCGNGKLLYSMELSGILSSAVGYEVSLSRSRMAHKFGEILGSDSVSIINKNFLVDTPNEIYDCIILVDIVFQMLSPLYDNAEKDTLEWICKHLISGGSMFSSNWKILMICY